MYPTMVMVLVQTQRSMADVCEISLSKTIKFMGPVASEARSETLGRLTYVVDPVHNTMMDNEAGSQRSRALQSHGRPEHVLDADILEVKDSLVAN